MNDGSFKMFCFYNLESNLSFNYVDSYLKSIGKDIKHFLVYEQDLLNKKYTCFKFNVSEVYSKMFLDKIEEYKKNKSLEKTYKYRRKKASIVISKIKQQVFDMHGEKCLCCGDKNNLSIDHIIPVKKGGTNKIDNLQPLCLSCNSKKNTKIIDYRIK